MSLYVNYNGKLKSASEALIPYDNRSFRYGDGVFETIRCYRGKALWMEYHLKRLEKSTALLKLTLPDDFSVDFLAGMISGLLHANNHLAGARVRLSVFRDAGGFYRPDNNNAGFLIESMPLTHEMYELNKNGLIIGIYNEAFKTANIFSGLKTSNALLYISASMHAQEKQWNDALILNSEGFVAEATSSNIFMVHEGKIYTPSLDQACVDGVMRSVILKKITEANYPVDECSLTTDDLLEADELFITNTIAGVQWIKGFQSKRYYHRLSGNLIEMLNTEIPAGSV
ncbi:MAG: 4-amino-4-deoxychorismate lyase [Bacteroidetes bacterium]|nr:MAG: 4-amino-4-deoxychorismate lyase [Bacteroidota bacterium]